MIPGAAQEGVGAFAEPIRKRIVMPMDEPPDLLYRLMVHELTHQFEFDIIPTSLMRRNVPLWVNEGLSDYMTGIWRPTDLMMVRDAAIADNVPKMSEMDDYGNLHQPRMVYTLATPCVRFIEGAGARKACAVPVRAAQSVIGGGENRIKKPSRSSPRVRSAVRQVLERSFKPFRDKERPADYGATWRPMKKRRRSATH